MSTLILKSTSVSEASDRVCTRAHIRRLVLVLRGRHHLAKDAAKDLSS